jgi:hypothetical protein
MCFEAFTAAIAKRLLVVIPAELGQIIYTA